MYTHILSINLIELGHSLRDSTYIDAACLPPSANQMMNKQFRALIKLEFLQHCVESGLLGYSLRQRLAEQIFSIIIEMF